MLIAYPVVWLPDRIFTKHFYVLATGDEAPLVTKMMARNIIGQSIFQSINLIIMVNMAERFFSNDGKSCLVPWGGGDFVFALIGATEILVPWLFLMRDS